MPDQGASVQRRSCERRSLVAKGFAVSATRDVDVLLTDISYSGCQLRAADDLKIGENVKLMVSRRGAVAAEIRWVMGKRAGARFLG